MSRLKKNMALLTATMLMISLLASLGLGGVTAFAAKAQVEVSVSGGAATIGNAHLERRFSTAGNKLVTSNIHNGRSGVDLTPIAGSEEFIVRLVEEGGTVPENVPPQRLLDRTGWSASLKGSDGTMSANADNMLDDNWDTVADCDRSGSNILPFEAVFDLNGEKTFQSFSYIKRPGNSNQAWGVNGTVTKYEFYTSNDGSNWTKASEGAFNDTMYDEGGMYNLPKHQYVNLPQPTTASYVKLVATDVIAVNGYYSFTCGEFYMYEDTATIYEQPVYEINASDLELAENGVIEATVEGGKMLRFAYEPYTLNSIPWSFTYNVVMYDGDPYMRSFLEVSVPEDKRGEARIDYIDCDALVLPEDIPEEALWSRKDIPASHLSTYYLGLGQPVYINSLFMGSEFPIADTRLVDGAVRMRYYSGKSFNQLELTTDGKFVTWQTVLGAARAADYEVVQQDFFTYIDDIATPTDFRVQFNSWFDYEHGITPDNLQTSFLGMEKGMTQSGFEPIDAYVADDGWNNYSGSFWGFKEVFSDGMARPSALADKLGANFGMWFSPRGGYDYYSSFATNIQNAGNGAKNPNGNDIDVNHPVYLEKVGDMMVDFQDNYNVEYWKLDGFAQRACTDASHGHMVGGTENMYYMVETWENWISIFERLRQNREEQGKGLFLNLTSYTPPSPWFLQWANTLFLQTTNDAGFAGPTNTDYGNRMLTHRDNGYYTFYVANQVQLPMKNIYNHDPVYGKLATRMLGVIPVMDTDAFRNYLFGNAVRGTAFWELYYSYDLMDEEKWMVNTEAMRFAKDNIDVLSKARMIAAAQPSASNGTVYAFSAWEADEGFVTVRNPSSSQKTYSLILDRLAGVPEGMAGLQMSYILPHQLNDDNRTYSYGDAINVTLEPFQMVIMKFAAEDTTAPVVVNTEVTDANTLRVVFDEPVFSGDATVPGNTVTGTRLLADYKTVEITVEDAFTPGDAVSGVANVTDASGVGTAASFATRYAEDRVLAKVDSAADLAGDIADENDPTLGGNAIIFTGETAQPANANAAMAGNIKMTLSMMVNTQSTGATLAGQAGSYTSVINSEGKVEFTVYSGISQTVTAASEAAVNDGNWHSVVLVREINGMVKIYIDGTLDGCGYEAGAKQPFAGGQVALGGSGFTGKLAAVAYYDNALAYDDIQLLVDEFYQTELSGVVTGADDRPVAGANVVLSYTGGAPYTTATDANGRYSFSDIPVRAYTARITAMGYSAATTAVEPVFGLQNTQNFALTAKAAADYYNFFETAEEIAAVLPLTGSTGTQQITQVEHNGSKALQVKFGATDNTARAAVYDSNAPMIKEGLFEFDVTPVDNPIRFGSIMRASAINNLALASVQDNATSYFGEYFTSGGGNAWTSVFTGPELKAGETYHFAMEFVGNTMTLSINGQQVVTQTSASFPQTAGFAGFHCARGNTFIMDNMEMTSYDAPAAGSFAVSGRVASADDGYGINGVVITLADDGNTYKGYSGVDGTYTIKNVLPGSYDATVQATNGYLSGGGTVIITDSDVNGLDFTLVYLQRLQEYYNGVKGLKEEDYSESSWVVFAAALSGAADVLAMTAPDQQQVNDALVDLKTAFEGLQPPYGGPTLTELERLYEDILALGLQENQYTTDSWARFSQASAAAKAVIDKTNPGSEEIKSVYDQLVAAWKELVLAATGQMDQLVLFTNLFSGFTPESYTAESWAPMQAALEKAREIIAAEDTSDTEINDAINALLAAQNGLVVEKTGGLVYLIKEADKLLEQADQYITLSVENLKKVVAASKKLLEKPEDELTMEMINSQALKLAEAISLMFEKGATAGLERLVAYAKLMREDMYTAASWQAFTQVLAVVEQEMAEGNMLPEDVTAAYGRLETGIRGLVVAANKTGLKVALDAAYGILQNAEKYIPASIAGLQEEWNKAKAIYDDPNAVQNAVNAAQADLLTKALAARKPANKQALKAALGLAGRQGTNGLSQTALDAAQKMANDANATQEAVDGMKLALDEAITGGYSAPATLPETRAATPAQPDQNNIKSPESGLDSTAFPTQESLPENGQPVMTPAKPEKEAAADIADQAQTAPLAVPEKPSSGVNPWIILAITLAVLAALTLTLLVVKRKKSC